MEQSAPLNIHQAKTPPSPADATAFLVGGGEMGALMRDHDWQLTPLGPPKGWPDALKTTVAILLASRHALFMFWGEDLLCFYNDAYARTLGRERHPGALGRPGREVWQEIWPIIGPQIAQIMSGGPATWYEGQYIPTTSGGIRQDFWWTYGYSAIHDPARPDRVAGALVICNDVTREHLAREALREAEQRTRLALASTEAIGTWTWDVAADIVRGDAGFARIYGVPGALAEEGGPIAAYLERVHEDDRPGLGAAVDRSLRTGEDFAFDYRIVHSDGSLRWVAASGRPHGGSAQAHPHTTPPGPPQHFPGVLIDVTARRQAEARRAGLVELGDRFGTARTQGDLAYAGAEVLSHYFAVSRAGYGTIDAVAETITIERDWCAPGVASLAGVLHFREYGSYIEDIKRGETVIVADARHDPRTAATADALAAISAQSFVNTPVMEAGRVVALFFVNHASPRVWSEDDVSFIREVAERTRLAVARRRAEADLRALNENLERQVIERTADRNRLWQLSTDIMIVLHPGGVVSAVNPAWTTLLGWKEGELVGANLFEFVHSDDRRQSLRAAIAVAGGKPLPRFENRLRHRDGTTRWIAWTAVHGDGMINAVGRDITAEREQAEALRQAEELLRQAQKMEAVGQLTGGLAHDFNNLLAGISGSLELLQVRVAQGRVGDLERYISAAQGAARRAASLTHRLLAFSRRQTLDPKPTNVNRLISGMEELIRRSVGPSIAIEVVGAAGLWTALVDPSQLESALLNLCINARDAMPDGGRITIETANVWMDQRTARERDLPPGQYLSLCVTDTGTGMPPEVIARAFDPFFTTKPIGQGTGLGLPMIYGFVRQSGGQVRVYSEVGHGTTMCLYLPRHDGHEATVAAETGAGGPAPARHGETVLVVDDEPTVRMLVTEVLEDLGYIALEAGDGAAGLRVVQSDARIDLLVTDVGLPGGMNGRQFAEAARVIRPGLEVLFITGYAENAVLGHGHLEAGMHVLTKPFAIEVLASRIEELIKN